jgi:hypothetical protein
MPEDTFLSRSPEATWRCGACNLLLGIHRDGALHIKYKELQATVIGRFRTSCRRCATPNETFAAPRSGSFRIASRYEQ